MSIEIKQVNVLDNPAPFTSQFKFEITFDCLAPGIKNELEWKLIYVGCADDDNCDQELDSVLVGPVQVGKNRFIFQAPCPDASKIPEKDLLDVTVLLLTCSYGGNEFMRVGYYVMNEYPGYNNDSGMALPSPIDISKIRRNILANKPRVTRFHIDWDDNNNTNNNNNNNNNGSNDNNGKNDNINNNNNNNNKNKNDSNNGNGNDSDEKWQNNNNGNGNNNNENKNHLNSILDENDYRLARALDEQYSNANNNNNNNNDNGDGDEEEEEEDDDGDANNNNDANDNANGNDNQENDEQDDDDMEMIS